MTAVKKLCQSRREKRKKREEPAGVFQKKSLALKKKNRRRLSQKKNHKPSKNQKTNSFFRSLSIHSSKIGALFKRQQLSSEIIIKAKRSSNRNKLLPSRIPFSGVVTRLIQELLKQKQ